MSRPNARERELVPLPAELRTVSSSVLEVRHLSSSKHSIVPALHSLLSSAPFNCDVQDYVIARLRQFSKAFGAQLVPGASEPIIEGAYQRALIVLGSDENRDVELYRVRFRHRCRCQRKHSWAKQAFRTLHAFCLLPQYLPASVP